MPRSQECRVCGKSFIPCGKGSSQIGAFNWREVACSEECGKKYLDAIIASRKPQRKIQSKPVLVEESLSVEKPKERTFMSQPKAEETEDYE